MAETTKTYTPAEMLIEVDNAIQKILVGGQSYKIGSRSLTRADLALLRNMMNELQAQLAAGEDTHLISDTYVAVFDGR